MKSKLYTLTLFLIGFLIASSATWAQEDPNAEFKALNDSRKERKLLIDYLRESGSIKEQPTGLIGVEEELDGIAKIAVEAENETREKLFRIIAEKEGRDVVVIAQEFYQRLTGQAKPAAAPEQAPVVKRLMRIDGSNTVGATLAPNLAEAYMKKLGYEGIHRTKDGVVTTVVGHIPSQARNQFSSIELHAHGSSTAFAETDETKKVGMSGNYADLGMASRRIKPAEAASLQSLGKGDLTSTGHEYTIALDGLSVIVHPDNPIDELSIAQVADIFSGALTDWASLGGGDLGSIKAVARDNQSGTWDSFKNMVLKPNKKTLRDDIGERFEDSKLLSQTVSQDPAAIGFIGLAYVSSDVKALKIKASPQSRGVYPSRLTVKTLDYPLARPLFFYKPAGVSDFAREFVEFTMSDDGQAVVDSSSLVGQGRPTPGDLASQKDFVAQILDDPAVLPAYKNLIRKADRSDSAANLRFATGSAEVNFTTNSESNFRRLSEVLSKPGAENHTVILIGFADSVGSDTLNAELSKRRADAVASKLRDYGVTKVRTAGFGEAMPVGDNNSESGRASNRRVEIWIER